MVAVTRVVRAWRRWPIICRNSLWATAHNALCGALPRAHHLPAELGPETATGVASAGSHRALDVEQVRLQARL